MTRRIVRGTFAAGILVFAWWAGSRAADDLANLWLVAIAAALLLVLFRAVSVAERRR